MRNSYILYKNVRALVEPIARMEQALIDDYRDSTLSKIWQDTLDLMPHRCTVYESKERNVYTLITKNHPTVECIVAKACYSDDLRDFFYTVFIDYRNGDSLYISPDVIRKWNSLEKSCTETSLKR